MKLFNFNKREEPKPQPKQIEYVSPYSEALIFGQYGNIAPILISAVYAALSIISNSIATLPIIVKQTTDNKTNVVPNHKIAKLFYNTLLSKHTLMKSLVWDLLLYGNSYLYIKRIDDKPMELIYLEHGDVTVDYDKLNGRLRYQISNHAGIPTRVNYTDVLHFAKDTRDGINGRGFLFFGADVIKLAGFTQQAAEDYFSTGCNIKGILSFKGQVKDEQKQKIRSQWQQIHGAGNAGAGIAVLEGDSNFIPVSQNSSESQMLETRLFNVTEIARLFNISPVLLGDLSHTNYSSIEDANIEYIGHCLLPIINLMQEEMNRKLMPNSTKYYIDIDETVLMQGNKTTMAGYFQTLVSNGILTINEARTALGYNELDGASDLIIPFTNIESNKISEVDESEE